VYLLIDKSDEYSLISYILTFKTIQFLSLGLLGLLVAAARFQLCAASSLERVSCEKIGTCAPQPVAPVPLCPYAPMPCSIAPVYPTTNKLAPRCPCAPTPLHSCGSHIHINLKSASA
jgi:hypothetical protein